MNPQATPSRIQERTGKVPASTKPDPPDGQGLEHLLEGVARGDEESLGSLYDAAGPRVYGVALRVLHDAGAAEEVTLDVFLKVWNDPQAYDATRGSPISWLLLLARSRAIDRLRSGAARRAREAFRASAVETIRRTVSPETAVVVDERREKVLAALEALPADQRTAIELAFFDGLTHVEIAARLGDPIGTVKTRIRLGMQKLRPLLGKWRDLE